MVKARDFYKIVKVKDPVTGEESEGIEVRDEFKQPPLREQIRAVNKQVLRNIGFHDDDEDVNPFE